MTLHYTCPIRKKAVSLHVDPPLQFRIKQNPTLSRAHLWVTDSEGNGTMLHSSEIIQNQFLCLRGEDVHAFYQDVVAEVKERVKSEPESINLDMVLQEHFIHFLHIWQEAHPVELKFITKSAYEGELLNYGKKYFCENKALLQHHTQERHMLLTLLRQNADALSPGDAFRKAALVISYLRKEQNVSGNSWTFDDFMRWLIALFEPSDLRALIAYAERTGNIATNQHMENAINIVLANIPGFLTAYVFRQGVY